MHGIRFAFEKSDSGFSIEDKLKKPKKGEGRPNTRQLQKSR